MSTESVHPILTDWVGERDQTTFVYQDNTNRLGWEKPGQAKSTSVLSNKLSPLNFLKEAYRYCSMQVRILLPGKRIPLLFDSSESYTDSQRVVIATAVADHKPYSLAERLDVMLGLTIHECAHLLYTDFSIPTRSDLHHHILNIIEDERIERLIGKQYPGYASYLMALKTYYFDHTYKKKSISTKAEELFDLFFKFVRFPKYIDTAQVVTHHDMLVMLKGLLTPYPITFQDAYTAAEQITDLLVMAGMSEVEHPDKSVAACTSEDDLLNALKATFDALDNDRKEELMRAMGQASKLTEDLTSPIDNPSIHIPLAKLLAKTPETLHQIYGDGYVGPSGETFFTHAPEDAPIYMQARTSVAPAIRSLISAISIHQAARTTITRGLKNGKLDTSKLVDAYLGKETIYTGTQKTNTTDLHIALLIDQSGSMGAGFNESTRIGIAQQVAILFKEATKQVRGVHFYCYGFTSGQSDTYSTSIYVYEEPGVNLPHALGSMDSLCSNKDGEAIRDVATRIRAFTQEPVLFLIISDGQPSGDDYNGQAAIEHTAEAVREVTKNRFIPIQVGIAVDPRVQSLMYDQFVNYTDSHIMVRELSAILKRNIPRLKSSRM